MRTLKTLKELRTLKEPRRAALRYHGGKWKLASWIIKHFPEHIGYCEPYGGAGSVLLRKEPVKIEVYNDLNGQVVNFFRVLRERTGELIRAIELTPYSRLEFLEAQEPASDELESARRLYIWAWQGRGRAGAKEPGGWRFLSRDTRAKTCTEDFSNIEYLWWVADRFKGVQIECDDALKVIKRFDTEKTLFYVDPPYVSSSRGHRWRDAAYRMEYTDQEHEQLARVLRQVKGFVVLSGYPSELYDRLYKGWSVVERSISKDNGKSVGIERLWISPRTWQELESENK